MTTKTDFAAWTHKTLVKFAEEAQSSLQEQVLATANAKNERNIATVALSDLATAFAKLSDDMCKGADRNAAYRAAIAVLGREGK